MPLILLYTDDVPNTYKVMLYGLIDYALDSNPATLPSLGLLVGHGALVWFSFFNTRYPSPYLSTTKDK
jgi:hypothetical protein